MKQVVLTLSLIVGVGTSGVAATYATVGFHGYSGGYHGGHYYGHAHGCSFAPVFALGFGLGALWTYPWGAWNYHPAYGYGYYYPSHAYVHPPPASRAPSPAAPSEAAHPAPAPDTPPSVPSSPGSGVWVPDPEPYSFAPGQSTTTRSSAAAPVNQTTSITTSPGGVPVYSNTLPSAG